ncbi:hypothetical protein BDY19DRAFT_478134 [Irpex rosettiformis]|uniref:Uncharacterized protein n=1 Tax=Irpex rosettiformis TaxID=378272 RepID=A0ACB8TS01_9APHY|nr:hypothetical protein BDY19DRAFT_478134 [Irpex rosettiformis]
MSASNQFTLDWYLLQDDYAILSSGVLWTLDYLDTLPLEIDMFWSRFIRIGKSKAKDRDAEAADKAKNKGLGLLLMILFFIGRYFTMLYAYVRISYLQPGKVSDKFCADTSYPATVAFELAAMCTNTLLLMRAWVLCGHNKLVLLLGIVVILARFAYGSYVSYNFIHNISLNTKPLCISDKPSTGGSRSWWWETVPTKM